MIARIAGTAGRLAAATAAVLLAGPVPPAAAGPNEIVPPTAGPTVVAVEVPVPVHDLMSDAARMGAAAAVGAALAAQLTATRVRRRWTPPPVALIDITETVQSR
jgi:hypothetical protein